MTLSFFEDKKPKVLYQEKIDAILVLGKLLEPGNYTNKEVIEAANIKLAELIKQL